MLCLNCCNLGLWAGAVWGEGILPLRQTKVGYHQSVVGGEGSRQEMPAQRAIEEPHFTLLSYNTCETQSKLQNNPEAENKQIISLCFSGKPGNKTSTKDLECSFCRRDKLCHSHHMNPARICGSGNQSGVLRENGLNPAEDIMSI